MTWFAINRFLRFSIVNRNMFILRCRNHIFGSIKADLFNSRLKFNCCKAFLKFFGFDLVLNFKYFNLFVFSAQNNCIHLIGANRYIFAQLNFFVEFQGFIFNIKGLQKAIIGYGNELSRKNKKK